MLLLLRCLISSGFMGEAVAKRLSGFEVEVIAYDKYKSNFTDQYVKEVNMNYIFKNADFVSLHTPLSLETKNLVNSTFINSFKKSFFLINTARGQSVVLEDLLKGLENKKIKGACLDAKKSKSLGNKSDVNNGYNANSNLQNYLRNIDDSLIDINNFVLNTDICKICNKGEVIPVDHEGIMVCNNDKCGKHIPYLIENEKPSYKEPPKEVCFYAYKRINHFREILAQFQAKESTQIPDKVIEDIVFQMKKERITIEQLNNKRAKDILKKLGYSKYYEHIPFIKEKLGVKPPIMSPELEEKLCNLFMEIQAPYAKYCPDGRVNFLNYYYTISKLCELLNEKEFLPYFPVLKDREKRIEQDDIWKKICIELGWKFIPTL